ncbi:hypothetical protein GKC29_04270 [Micromonospora sp. WMMC415]|uniref:hypothetical protein n=1 Tax=Micromonospora sp. WMMC415 TaxID=2675222 RepID=UPI0012B48BA8|nr:hypothetical protein [Micromonospora sp. WMMC415]QGN46136.1 hypothetical protein GKC29_04270 [Micromonospora sp. WMMC415]
MIEAMRERMGDAGTSLVRSGAARSFEISDEDSGLRLRVFRAGDGATATATMTETTEVYFVDLGNGYKMVRTAYDDEDKLAVLDDFLEAVRVFIEGNYYEEIGKRNGRVVSRRMYFDGSGGAYWLSASLGLRAAFRRLLGYQKSVVRSPKR